MDVSTPSEYRVVNPPILTPPDHFNGAPPEKVRADAANTTTHGLKGSPTVQHIVQRVGESEGAPCGIIGIFLAINDEPKHG
jgi:hypothetical protein